MKQIQFGKSSALQNVFDIRRKSRRTQLREIAVACARLEERKCKCGCGIKFRVLPESDLIYGAYSHAQRAGWKPRLPFEPQYQMDRRWVWPVQGIDAPVEK